jgi:hypothetical protein
MQHPVLQYPDGIRAKFLAAWGREEKAVTYSTEEHTFHPKTWNSVLRIYEDGELARRDHVATDAALRYRNVTFNQVGCIPRFDLQAGDLLISGIPADHPFTIPEMEGEFRLRNPRIGTLSSDDTTTSPSTPSAELQYRPPSVGSEPEWEPVAELLLGAPIEVMHSNLLLANLKLHSVINYNYGPQASYVWAAMAGVLIFMVLRLYLPWYQVRCHIEDSADQSVITISIRMVGLLARPQRLKQRISSALIG